MTIYTKMTVNGSRIDNIKTSQILKSTGVNNTSSKFVATLDNTNGKLANSFTIGDTVELFAEQNINPPTNKIFSGILENIRFPSHGLFQQTEISGKDFTSELIDRTVEPEIYTNLPAGSIVKDIISKYTDNITVNNVQDSTTTIDRRTFNHTPVFDAIKGLAETAQFTFYIDSDKDLHFVPINSESSGYTFDNTNVMQAKIKEQRNTVFNEIWVYGDRTLDSFKEEFISDGAGSVYTLEHKPDNTIIDIGSPLSEATRNKGAIYKLNILPESGTDYLINYDDLQIIFVSGTTLGYSSIPASGALITIDYQRTLPIVKVGRDQTSIDKYGKRVKVITDKSIKDPETAQQKLSTELNENNRPKKEGNIDVKGFFNITPSQTTIINLPHQDVNNQTYEILEAQYNFNKQNNIKETVLSLKVNKKIDDITDTIKKLINDVQTLQSQDISDADIITRFEFTMGSIGIRQSGVIVSTRNIAGDTLIWNNNTFGIWGTGKWGDEANVSFVLGNPLASILGTTEMGTQSSSFNIVYSGGYP